jgi:hypothetical protein
MPCGPTVSAGGGDAVKPPPTHLVASDIYDIERARQTVAGHLLSLLLPGRKLSIIADG